MSVRARYGQAFGRNLRLIPLVSPETPWLLRIVPDHTFLECSDHAVRLAQKIGDVDRIYEGAVAHLSSCFDRPFAASVSMGYKWIEDFIDDRRAPNAYASHSLFGLRGRFFPRMVRSLLNAVSRDSDALIVDPFGGVGTLGIESSLLGIRSRSYDINPFFTSVSQAKHKALLLTRAQEQQLDEVRNYAQTLRTGSDAYFLNEEPPTVTIPAQLGRGIAENNLKLLADLKRAIAARCSDELRPVAMLAIAYYAKSMATKYPRQKILTAFWAHLSKVMYLSRFMKHLYEDGLCVKPGVAEFGTRDVKELGGAERLLITLGTTLWRFTYSAAAIITK